MGHGCSDPRASGSCSGLGSTLCSPTPVHSCAGVQTLPFAFRLSEIKWEKALGTYLPSFLPSEHHERAAWLCHTLPVMLDSLLWDHERILLPLSCFVHSGGETGYCRKFVLRSWGVVLVACSEAWALVFPGRKEMLEMEAREDLGYYKQFRGPFSGQNANRNMGILRLCGKLSLRVKD